MLPSEVVGDLARRESTHHTEEHKQSYCEGPHDLYIVVSIDLYKTKTQRNHIPHSTIKSKPLVNPTATCSLTKIKKNISPKSREMFNHIQEKYLTIIKRNIQL